MFIPLFEPRINGLRELTQFELTMKLGHNWDNAAKAEWKDIQDAILTDPCLKRFN